MSLLLFVYRDPKPSKLPWLSCSELVQSPIYSDVQESDQVKSVSCKDCYLMLWTSGLVAQGRGMAGFCFAKGLFVHFIQCPAFHLRSPLCTALATDNILLYLADSFSASPQSLVQGQYFLLQFGLLGFVGFAQGRLPFLDHFQ